MNLGLGLFVLMMFLVFFIEVYVDAYVRVIVLTSALFNDGLNVEEMC